MIKTEQLYYLTQVEKYGSIHKAAEKLYITSSAVSLAIKQLEKECGYALLERTYRGVRFTEDGKHVVQIAEQILSLHDEILALKPKSSLVLKEKYRLVTNRTAMKLLSRKIINPNSKVLEYFSLQEVDNIKRNYYELLTDNTVMLMILSKNFRERLENDKRVRVRYLYASKQYPISAKKTKHVKEYIKKIPYDEFLKLPKVQMRSEYDTLIEGNVVLSTEDATVYADAIRNDLGLGLVTRFAHDVMAVDYFRDNSYRIYEPYDEEIYVAMIALKSENDVAMRLLERLIKGE